MNGIEMHDVKDTNTKKESFLKIHTVVLLRLLKRVSSVEVKSTG